MKSKIKIISMCLCVFASNANGMITTNVGDVIAKIQEADDALKALIAGSNRTGMLSNSSTDIQKELVDATDYLQQLDKPLTSEEMSSLTQLVATFEADLDNGVKLDNEIEKFIEAFKAFKESVDKKDAPSLKEVKKLNESTLKALDESKSFTKEFLINLALKFDELKKALDAAKTKAVSVK